MKFGNPSYDESTSSSHKGDVVRVLKVETTMGIVFLVLDIAINETSIFACQSSLSSIRLSPPIWIGVCMDVPTSNVDEYYFLELSC